MDLGCSSALARCNPRLAAPHATKAARIALLEVLQDKHQHQQTQRIYSGTHVERSNVRSEIESVIKYIKIYFSDSPEMNMSFGVHGGEEKAYT